MPWSKNNLRLNQNRKLQHSACSNTKNLALAKKIPDTRTNKTTTVPKTPATNSTKADLILPEAAAENSVSIAKS
jgi:hypothetical protein